MLRICLVLCSSLLLLLASACSGDDADTPDGAVDAPIEDGGEDAGEDAGQDAGEDAAEDAGQDAGTRPDVDPTDNFLLEVPAGAGMCTVFCEGRTWQEEHAMMGRVALKPGFYVLPRSTDPLDLDLVEGVFFGPEQLALQAAGAPSTEVREYYGAWQYILRQDFLQDSTPVQLELWIWYEPSMWGSQWPAENPLAGEFAATWTWASLVVGPGSGWCEDHLGFGFCDLSAVPELTGEGTTAAGDGVELHFAYASGCQLAGNTACRDLWSASLTLDGQQRQIDGRETVVYSAGHHNYQEKVLLLLDPPLGGAAAVLVELPDLGQTSGGALSTLDADFNELSSSAFDAWQVTYP